MNQLSPLHPRERNRFALQEMSAEPLDGGGFSGGRSAGETNLLTEYLRSLARWRWVIASCALAGALLSVLLNLGVAPVFQARTSLDIQSLNSDFMNMHMVAPTGDGAAPSSETYVQTQVKLLQSTTLLERTVAQLKARPHPPAVEQRDLLSTLKRTLHLSRGGELPYDALVDDTARRLKVKPLGLTRLVEVTCDSWDPAFAAQFCNTLTEQFKEADFETRGTEAHQTSEWLERQAADIRDKAEESRRKLEAATGGDGLALSQESTAIGEDRLRALQGELVRAQAERMEREAQARIAATASPDSVPAVLESPTYRQLKEKLGQLNQQIAQLVPPLTEENPKVIHLRSQIREVQADLAQERASVLARLRNDFDSARRREDLLTASYAALQTSVSGEMSKTTRVTLLRREVESEQQLYQTLLQRAKEAGFASAMQVSTIRVVDRAQVPKVASSPRRGMAAVLGLILGGLCGVGFALFRDRNANVFREPGEVERLLQVHELGVIPNNAALRSRPVLATLRSGTESRTDGRTDGRTGAPVEESGALSCWGDTFSIVAEAYRNTTHSILLSRSNGAAGNGPRIYVVTSPNAGEGKTTVTTNLGVALSKSRLRVVLVEGDLRKPGLHKNLMVDNTAGVRDVLREEIDASSAPLGEFCRQTVIPNLWLVPSGSGREEVVELLHAARPMAALLDRLAREFDIVLIDTPPMLHMADARIFAARASGVILVVRAGITSRDQAAAACDLFDHDRVSLMGIVLNDFNPAKEGRGKYYQSYYRYKQASEQQQVGARL